LIFSTVIAARALSLLYFLYVDHDQPYSPQKCFAARHVQQWLMFNCYFGMTLIRAIFDNAILKSCATMDRKPPVPGSRHATISAVGIPTWVSATRISANECAVVPAGEGRANGSVRELVKLAQFSDTAAQPSLYRLSADQPPAYRKP
jgi:hypothetical protein